MIFIMAWRNIWRNKMRSLVIMASIVIGLIAGIAILALYQGMMNSRVRTVINAEVGHLQLHDSNFKKDYEPGFIIGNSDNIVNEVRIIPGIKMIATRSITNGMLSTTTGSAGVQVNGIVPDDEYKTSQLEKKIVEGKQFEANRKYQVMIGKKLAKKVKLKTGSKLVLTFTDSSGTLVSGAFRVIAIYESDNAPLDERNVYIQQPELNEMLGTGNAFHEIVLLLKNDKQLPEVQDRLKKQYPALLVENWKQISPETDLLVKTVDQYSYIVMVIIMLALAFGIINTMLMAIIERTREIGMMLALGTAKLKIFSLVLLETIFLTLAGTPVGLLLGWVLTNYFNKHGLDFSGMGKEMMSSFGFGMVIHPEFPADKIMGVMLIVFSTALLSCIFPAIKALRLQPVEALRT